MRRVKSAIVGVALWVAMIGGFTAIDSIEAAPSSQIALASATTHGVYHHTTFKGPRRSGSWHKH